MSNMRSTFKEHLLDESEVELSQSSASYHQTQRQQTNANYDEQQHTLELNDTIRKWQLDYYYPNKTTNGRISRISNQDNVDRAVIIACGFVILLHVISCALAMWIYPSTAVLELLFTLSFLQGPFVINQRLQFIKSKSKREIIAMIWGDIVELRQTNSDIEAELDRMNGNVQKIESNLSRYKAMIKGYDFAEVKDLYHENQRINEQNKLLAEAIGIVELTQSILRTDADGDHHVGDAELMLLSKRVESIEGIPFTNEEMCNRFKLEETRTLRILADVVRTLYIEKRRERVAAKASDELHGRKSPRTLGSSLLWKRKIDGIGIMG